MKLSVALLFALFVAIFATFSNAEDCHSESGQKCMTKEELLAVQEAAGVPDRKSLRRDRRYFVGGDPCFVNFGVFGITQSKLPYLLLTVNRLFIALICTKIRTE